MYDLHSNLCSKCLLFHDYPNTTYWKVELLTDTISNGEIKSGVGRLVMKTHQSPYNGSCHLSTNVTTGYALETNFTIQCINWIDDDGYIVSYEFLG